VCTCHVLPVYVCTSVQGARRRGAHRAQQNVFMLMCRASAATCLAFFATHWSSASQKRPGPLGRGSRLGHQTLLVAVSVSMVSTACTLSAHSYRTVCGTPMAETACFPLAPPPAPALPPTPALHRMAPPGTDNQVCGLMHGWCV